MEGNDHIFICFDIIFVLNGVKQKAREPLSFVDKIE